MSYCEQIIISGAYGTSNLGDEAILYGFLRILRQEDALAKIVVLSYHPQETGALHRVGAIPRLHFPRAFGYVLSRRGFCPFTQNDKTTFETLVNADLVILGGGGLFYDYPIYGAPSWKSPVSYRTSEFALMKCIGKPVAIYAVGIGPVQTLLGKLFIHYVGNHADYFSVRDMESKAILTRFGVKMPIRVVPDPAIMLKPVYTDRVGDITRVAGKTHLSVAVNIRPWVFSKAESSVFVRSIARLCDELISNYGASVVLIPMHSKDIQCLGTVYDCVNQKAKVVFVDQILTAPEVAGMLKRMAFVVSMRLHTLVLAAAQGVPSIGFAYAPKIAGFLNQTGQYDFCLELAPDIDRIALDAIERLIPIIPQVSKNLLEWKSWAEQESMNAIRAVLNLKNA